MANQLAVLSPEASVARRDAVLSGLDKAEVAVRAPGAVVETKDLYDLARTMLEGWLNGTIELKPSGYGYKQFDPAEFLVGMVRKAEQHREISPKQFAAFAGLAQRHLGVTVIQPTH